MTGLPARRPARRRPSTEGEIGLGILALLLVAALVSTLATVVPEDASRVLAAGDMLPLETRLLNGESHDVVIPGATLTLQVGAPVSEVAHAHVDLGDDADWSSTDPVRPATGARLVPVTWSARPTANVPRQAPDATEVTVTFVTGHGRGDLARGTVEELVAAREGSDPASRVLALEEDLSEDLTVEVDYAGTTQVLDVAGGTVDTGAADGLYTPAATIGTGCSAVEDWCHLTAARHAAWRPGTNDANFVAGSISTHAYDEQLGWAGEGRLWASLYLQDFTIHDVVDASGARREVTDQDPLAVTLDGARPERNGLGRNASHGSRRGQVTFAIDIGERSRELVLRSQLTLEGTTSPRVVPLRSTVTLSEG